MGSPDPKQYLGGSSSFDESTGQYKQPTDPNAPDPRQTAYDGLVQQVSQAADPQQAAVATDQLGRQMFQDFTKAGHDVKWEGEQLIVDGRPYVLAGAAGAGGAAATFPRSSQPYTPGTIDTLDNFQPNTGPVGDATEQGVLDLLRNPESLDAHTTDMMKAASREEASAQAAQADEDLLRFGFDGGFDDSRWLASERAANQRGRDEAVIRGNRTVDLEAARTNKEDRRQALGIGQAYTALKSDNAFKTAALQGDRLALRETVNARAAELGLSGDELQLNYTLGLMDDAVKRYGIDVGAQIDREKLSQAGREFQEELSFKFSQLEQADAQFGAEYGLDLAKFGADEDQRAFDNSFKLTQ
jgi:hypothetical protein